VLAESERLCAAFLVFVGRGEGGGLIVSVQMRGRGRDEVCRRVINTNACAKRTRNE